MKIADAVNLVRIDGVVCQRFLLIDTPGGSPGTTLQVSGSTHAGGVVIQPIGGTTAPATWSAGEICSQSTQFVGFVGGAAIEEVVEAHCESGWDAYCDPGCAASVGSTITLVDPGVLVGG
jgi:hypothetical protein